MFPIRKSRAGYSQPLGLSAPGLGPARRSVLRRLAQLTLLRPSTEGIFPFLADPIESGGHAGKRRRRLAEDGFECIEAYHGIRLRRGSGVTSLEKRASD